MLEDPEGATRTVTARLFVRELDARGVDAERALAAAGLTRDVVNDADVAIPWAQCMRLIAEALQLAPSDDLGVLAGASAELTDLDLAGLYLRTSSSGREAFQFHHENRDVFGSSNVTHTYLTDSALVIALVPQPQTPAGIALAECTLAAAVSIIPDLAGPLPPLEARFRHRRPANAQAHSRIFGRVSFECDIDALFYPLEVFDRAWPYRDDTTRAVLKPHVARQAEALHAANAADLPTRVLHAIQQELAEGRAAADSLAKRLRISPRSLRRGLSSLDTSYSDLLARARRELAIQLAVELPRRSGPDIARLLGYAEAHTFYRAFKRWTGASLSEYRKQSCL
jgi:AraC-like DNA-binding protein